jgi:phosphatidylethanolamine N-methyltransferase
MQPSLDSCSSSKILVSSFSYNLSQWLDQLLTDIERTYGQRKLLAQRVPLMPRSRKSVPTDPLGEAASAPSSGRSKSGSISSTSSDCQAFVPSYFSTAALREADMATETDETEMENESEVCSPTSPSNDLNGGKSLLSSASFISKPKKPWPPSSYQPPASQHDLMNSYFRKDALLLSNIDLLRQVFLTRPCGFNYPCYLFLQNF